MPSEKIDLPPMPEPDGTAEIDHGPTEGGGRVISYDPAWSQPLVTAYALLAVKQERERAAKLCETLDHGAFGPSSYLSGIHDGSIGCAKAIRKGEDK